MTKQIMLIEHDEEARDILAEHLRAAGYDVICPVDSYVALELAEDTAFDLVLFNDQMPIIVGIDFLHTLRNTGFTTPAIVFTQAQTLEDAPEFDALPPVTLVQKPFQTETLLTQMDKLINS